MWGKTNATTSTGRTTSTLGSGFGAGAAKPGMNTAGRSTGIGSGIGTGTGTGLGLGRSTGFGLTGAYGAAAIPDTPISTMGIIFDPFIIELQANSDGQNKPFKVMHIAFYEIFRPYSIEEMRYYDYLRHGDIKKTAQAGLSQLGVNMNSSGRTNTSLTGIGQKATIPYPVSPWQAPIVQIMAKQAVTQTQPYGVLPPTQLTDVNNHDTEDKSTNDTETVSKIPEPRGFGKKQSLLDTIQKRSLQHAQTPGMLQPLIARKIVSAYSQSNETTPLITEAMWAKATTSQENGKEAHDSTLSNIYAYIPNIQDLIPGMFISNFMVVHQEFGSITFPLAMDVLAFRPTQTIKFDKGQITVSANPVIMKSAGITDAFPSLVSLNEVWPSGQKTKDPTSLREYENDLKMFCFNHQLTFVSYEKTDGTFRFAVPTLSKFPIAPPV